MIMTEMEMLRVERNDRNDRNRFQEPQRNEFEEPIQNVRHRIGNDAIGLDNIMNMIEQTYGPVDTPFCNHKFYFFTL